MILRLPLLKLIKEMINYDNEKGTGADSGLVFAEMAKEARQVSKTVCPKLVSQPGTPNLLISTNSDWIEIFDESELLDFKVKIFEISIQQDTRVNL